MSYRDGVVLRFIVFALLIKTVMGFAIEEDYSLWTAPAGSRIEAEFREMGWRFVKDIVVSSPTPDSQVSLVEMDLSNDRIWNRSGYSYVCGVRPENSRCNLLFPFIFRRIREIFFERIRLETPVYEGSQTFGWGTTGIFESEIVNNGLRRPWINGYFHFPSQKDEGSLNISQRGFSRIGSISRSNRCRFCCCALLSYFAESGIHDLPLTAGKEDSGGEQEKSQSRNPYGQPITPNIDVKWRFPLAASGMIVAFVFGVVGFYLIDASSRAERESFANVFEIATGTVFIGLAIITVQAALDILDLGQVYLD